MILHHVSFAVAVTKAWMQSLTWVDSIGHTLIISNKSSGKVATL